MAFDFAQVVDSLAAFGFYDYVLPFLLVFVIVYAILEKYKILGEKKTVNGVVALVVGLFATYFAKVFEVGKFLSFFGTKSVLVIIILLFAMMIAVFVFRTLKQNEMIKPEKEAAYALGIFAASLAIMFLALNSSPGTWTMLFGEGTGIGSDAIVAVILISVLLAFVAWAVGG